MKSIILKINRTPYTSTFSSDRITDLNPISLGQFLLFFSGKNKFLYVVDFTE